MTGSKSDNRAGDSSAQAEEIRVGWRMAGLGMQVSSEVLAGLLLGWLYDFFQGTAPTGATVGAIIGIVVGMVSLVRGSMKLMKALDERHPTTGRGRLGPRPTGAKSGQMEAAEAPPSHEEWKKAWDDENDDWNDASADDDRDQHHAG